MNYRIEQLRFQVREDPSSRHFYQLGELLRRQGELDEAVEVLRAGLEHHPEYVAAWVSLGRALFQAERFDESRPAFSRALELDRQNAVAATLLGRAAARLGDWPQAAEALDLAAALVPSDEELAAEAEDARAHLEAELPIHQAPEVGEPVEDGGAQPPADDGEESGAGEPPPASGKQVPEPGGSETEPADDGSTVEEPIAVESPPVFPAPVPRSRELAFVSEEDPWSVAPRGDTGVFLTGEDVFATVVVSEPQAPEEEISPLAEPVHAGSEAAPAVFEAEAAPPVELPGGEAPPLEEALPVEGEPSEELLEAQVEAPPEAEVEPPLVGEGAGAAMARGVEAGEFEAAETVELAGVPEEVMPSEPVAGVTAGEIPLPTATLARLALEQGDLPLAEKTARAVLERNPDSEAAQEILETVARRRTEVAGTPAGRVRRKIEVLENWLGRVRRAAAARVS